MDRFSDRSQYLQIDGSCFEGEARVAGVFSCFPHDFESDRFTTKAFEGAMVIRVRNGKVAPEGFK